MKDETILVHAARDPERHHGIVNPPVYHASTILYPTVAAFKARRERRYDGVMYGAYGTPTTFALADAVAAAEGGRRAVATSSGLAAVTLALHTLVQAGDHVLVADSVYGPTRAFCDTVLARFGVETTYYDPHIGADIAGLMRDNTRVVFTESPGSLTFEVQDIPAIAAAAHARGALVLLDNTWATPLFFKPFAHGVDVSIQAGTKYIAGHSDLVIGIITTADDALYRRLKDGVSVFGDVPGPDDCYLALRGLRSLAARLERHQASGLAVARWLAGRPEVKRLLHPALPGDPGHDLWRRDFTGATSLFGVVLHTGDEAAVERMVAALRLFRIGASWGGYESLILPGDPTDNRTAVPWREPGYLLRLHVGLEDPGDLIADLERGLAALGAAAPAAG